MAFTTINEVDIKTDFEARDITIINYNATLADIKAYLEVLVGNTNYIKNITLRDETMLPFFHYGATEPAPSLVEEGDLWFEVEE